MLAAKAELRERIWSDLREHRLARFPGARGRIPNFVGAEAAAERLRGTEAWQRAVLECPRRPPERARIRWEELTEEKVAAIPLLGQLRRGRSTAG